MGPRAWVLLLAALLPWPGNLVVSAPVNCTLDALAVGLRLNSSKDLTRLTKKHAHVLVGFSAPTCVTCCLWEPLYKEALELLPSGVRFARVDTDRVETRGLAQAYDVESLPGVVFFRERKPYRLLEPHSKALPRTLAALVQRALQPLPVAGKGSHALAPWHDLRAFVRPLGATSAPAEDEDAAEKEQEASLETLHFVRVFARHGADEDPEDLEELTDAARAFAGRPASFQFVSITEEKAKQELSKHPLVKVACGSLGATKRTLVALALLDGEYVSHHRVTEGKEAHSVLVRLPKTSVGRGLVFNLSRTGGEPAASEATAAVLPRVTCRALDAYDGLSSMSWVLHASLPAVGRFDIMTSSLYEQTQKPFLMLFVNLAHPELPSWLELLHKAHVQYNGNSGAESSRLMFVYVDGLRYTNRMPSLGLAADPQRLPALSFNDVTEQVLAWQPSVEEYRNGSAALSSDVIDSLIQRYLTGGTRQLKEGAAPKSLAVPKRAPDEKRDVPALDSLSLEQRLRFVPAVNQESFSEVVLDDSKDVMVLLYSSKGPAAAASTERAIYVNRCAERFEELGISTVRVARIDLAEFTAPPSVQISEVPALVLFPAFAKEPPHAMYRGKYKVQHIMWWVEDHASRKFRLPELPHLDELEAAAYWEQKSELPPERQQRVARENEGSVHRAATKAPPARRRARSRGRRASAPSEL